MVPVPKPKFFDRKVPAGQSRNSFFNEICARQTHILRDAIDRVSFLVVFSIVFHSIFLACLSLCYGSSRYFDVAISENRF